jgi:hypothetical protein
MSHLVDTFNAAVEFGRRRIGKARYEYNSLARFLFCAPIINRVTWFLWKLRSRIQYTLTGKCGNMCETVEPFGFVPEAECPIHDR